MALEQLDVAKSIGVCPLGMIWLALQENDELHSKITNQIDTIEQKIKCNNTLGIKFNNLPRCIYDYQQDHESCDIHAVDKAIKCLGCNLSCGQILYHGGQLKFDCDSSKVILKSPLSTTLDPYVARVEALWYGKAYKANALVINLLTIKSPKTQAYPLFLIQGDISLDGAENDVNLRHEYEIILCSGIKLQRTHTITLGQYKVVDCGEHIGATKMVDGIAVFWDVWT